MRSPGGERVRPRETYPGGRASRGGETGECHRRRLIAAHAVILGGSGGATAIFSATATAEGGSHRGDRTARSEDEEVPLERIRRSAFGRVCRKQLPTGSGGPGEVRGACRPGEYRAVATSIGGFVQQLAVAYLRNGYWFYVAGYVPPAKDPAAVDRKLIERYEIARSKWSRARRKKEGLANLQYLRFERFFLLLATHGKHRFFEDEAKCLRDARRQPITFAGYSIGHRCGRPHVRVERLEHRLVRDRLLRLALVLPTEALEREFMRLPFEPYAPVRRQLLALRRAVNWRRKLAGLEPVPVTCIRLRRRIYRPFEPRGAGPRHDPTAGANPGTPACGGPGMPQEVVPGAESEGRRREAGTIRGSNGTSELCPPERRHPGASRDDPLCPE